MKYFVISVLIFISVLSISCSKEDTTIPNNHSEEQLMATTSANSGNARLYVGVIGHKSNRELHGEIRLFRNNQSRYKAAISLVDGTKYSLYAEDSSSDSILTFEGDGISFEMDTTNQSSPIFSNIDFKGEFGGYIKVVDGSRDPETFVILGTYEETGNESVFYGNWDMIVSKAPVVIPTLSNLSSLPPTYTPYLVDEVIVSHHGNGTPFIDTDMEDYTNPANCFYDIGRPEIWVSYSPENINEIDTIDIKIMSQTSIFNTLETSWNLVSNYSKYAEDVYYGTYECGTMYAGSWSRNGREGSIYVINGLYP